MFVLSVGGSIVAPDGVDTRFVTEFIAYVRRYLEEHGDERMIFVIGGGGPARRYQQAYREIAASPDDTAQDWIGVMATRLNAELIRHTLAPLCSDPVVTNPEGDFAFTGRILVAAGWKPGFSTDYDAVCLADRFGADTVVNLSNIERVYSADPKIDRDARPLDRITWSEFKRLVGENWKPGSNLPFDPVATAKASEMGLRVVTAAGRNLENLAAILDGRPFTGTEIVP